MTLKKYDELSMDIKECILPVLKPYFDQITFLNRNKWLMLIYYANKSIFESFETYEFDLSKQEEAFEEKKIKLFMDGVLLYYIHAYDHIELIGNGIEASNN